MSPSTPPPPSSSRPDREARVADATAPPLDPGRLSERGEEVVLRGVNLSRDFACHSCGNCCRGEGQVFVSRERAVAIAEHLGITLGDFRATYTRDDVPGGHLLRDRSADDDACIFLDDANRCRVHPVKPDQCRTFPFRWRNRNFTTTCAGFLALHQRLADDAPPTDDDTPAPTRPPA